MCLSAAVRLTNSCCRLELKTMDDLEVVWHCRLAGLEAPRPVLSIVPATRRCGFGGTSSPTPWPQHGRAL